MRFFRRLANLASCLRPCFSDRTAWIFAALHATWFAIAIANMSASNPGLAKFLEDGGWSSGTIFAGRPFHFHYEWAGLKLLFLCDLPSLLGSVLLAVIISPLVHLLHVGLYSGSYVEAGLMWAVATLQWLVFGSVVQRQLSKRQRGTWFVSRLEEYSIPLILAVLLFGCIVTPIVNRRSQQRGFRQPAMSFSSHD